MYAVIFTAELNDVDDEYERVVKKMRALAFEKYHCVSSTSVVEGNTEVTISYWNSLEDMHDWKRDNEHLKAQSAGKRKWYSRYDVKVLEVLREYQSGK